MIYPLIFLICVITFSYYLIKLFKLDGYNIYTLTKFDD
jgi:hypothetical protein